MTQTGEQPARRPPERHRVGHQIRHDIDRMLERRSAPSGTLRARAEDEAKREGARVWHALKERPSIGALLFGGLAIAAADAVGIGELAMGLTIAYAAWQVFRKGEPVGVALAEAERLDKI